MQLFRYEIVFRARFLHFYYRSKTTGDLGCHPSENCLKTLQNYDLRFRQEKDGFSVYGASDGSGNLLKPIKTPLKFTFLLNLKNPSFVNFSDLPLQVEPKKIYYFNNREVNKVTPSGMTEKQLLNHDGQVSADDMVTVAEKHFSFTSTGPGDTATAVIKGVENDLTYREQTAVKSGGKFSFHFKLEGLKPGRYKAETGGVEKGRFYYPGKQATETAFGFVEIFTDVPNDHKFTNSSGKIIFREYSILFMNRKTFWRYRVSNPENKVLPDPEIGEATHPWDFDHIGGLEFVSRDTIPLSEEIIQNIVFKSDKTDANSVLVQHLPNPSVSLIQPDTLDPTKVFSEIHIYI